MRTGGLRALLAFSVVFVLVAPSALAVGYGDLTGMASVAAAAKCTDTDSGAYYTVAGACKTAQGTVFDSCSGDTLTESYCSGSKCVTKTVNCAQRYGNKYTCKSGACVKAPAATTTTTILKKASGSTTTITSVPTQSGGWANIIVKDSKGNTVETATIKVGGEKTLPISKLKVRVVRVRAQRSNVIAGTDLYVGSSSEGIVKTYSSKCGITGTGSSDTKFPGSTEWCIQAKTSGDGVIEPGDEIQVVWMPASKPVTVPLEFSQKIDSGAFSWHNDQYSFSLYFKASKSKPNLAYLFRFEKRLDLARYGSGTMDNPVYFNAVPIKILGKDLYIVGVGVNRVMVVTGTAGTATPTSPVSYGNYRIYSDIGSSG